MAKKIQVVVDVESDSVKFATDQTLTLTQQVRLLRQELQKVPEGTKEWTLLQQKYNETKDSLDRVNVKSKELFGTMSALPGPIGNVAGQLDNTIGTLKTFSAIKFSDIKTQFVELGKDISGIAKNILDATGITKAYTTLNNALAASFIKVGVGETAAAAGARAFSAALIATGIGALIVLLGTAASALYEMATGEKEAAEAANQLNKALENQNELLELNQKDTQRRNKVEIARLKAQGKDAQTIRDTQFRQAKEAYEKAYKDEQDAVKIYNDNLGKADTEGLKKLSDNLTKRQQATKDAYATAQEIGLNNKAEELKEEEAKNKELAGKRKAASDKAIVDKKRELDDLKKLRDQALAEVSKGEEDAFKATLTTREKEEYEINQKYAALIATATKYGLDTKILEAGLQAELKTMRDGFAKEDLDKSKKDADEKKKEVEDANKLLFEAETTAAELKYAQGLQSEEEYQAALYAIKLKYATTETERQQAEIDFLDFAKAKQKEYEETVKTANKALTESYINLASNIGSSFTEIANLFEKGSDLQKTFAIIGVLVNAAASIGKIKTSTAEAVADFSKTIATGTATVASGLALITNPVTAAIGAAQIAAGKTAIATGTAGIATAKAASTVQQVSVGITAAAQIAAITSAGKSGGGAATGGSAAGGQAPTPAFNGTVSVPAPQIGASQATQSGTLATTIAGAVAEGNSKSRPIQTYVVGDQISTQQQLDRRISAAAKMGG